MNRLYPVFLRLEGVPCVVVGAGAVALRKIETLLECGALVKVVAPRGATRVGELADAGAVEWVKRDFRAEDARGARIIIAATDDESVNRAVWEAAQSAGALCNVADEPELCDFHAAATVARGDLKIALSTNGRCPAFAARLRARLEQEMGDAYAKAVAELGRIRDEIRARHPEAAPEKMRRLEKLVASDALWDTLRRNDSAGLETILESWKSSLLD